jgi:hypothetical protein
MTGPEQTMKVLQLMDKAASAISDADLVDGLIHGYGFFSSTSFAVHEGELGYQAQNNIGP